MKPHSTSWPAAVRKGAENVARSPAPKRTWKGKRNNYCRCNIVGFVMRKTVNFTVVQRNGAPRTNTHSPPPSKSGIFTEQQWTNRRKTRIKHDFQKMQIPIWRRTLIWRRGLRFIGTGLGWRCDVDRNRKCVARRHLLLSCWQSIDWSRSRRAIGFKSTRVICLHNIRFLPPPPSIRERFCVVRSTRVLCHRQNWSVHLVISNDL